MNRDLIGIRNGNPAGGSSDATVKQRLDDLNELRNKNGDDLAIINAGFTAATARVVTDHQWNLIMTLASFYQTQGRRT